MPTCVICRLLPYELGGACCSARQPVQIRFGGHEYRRRSRQSCSRCARHSARATLYPILVSGSRDLTRYAAVVNDMLLQDGQGRCEPVSESRGQVLDLARGESSSETPLRQ